MRRSCFVAVGLLCVTAFAVLCAACKLGADIDTIRAELGVDNKVSFIVTFNSNGGSGTTPSAQTASSGSSITLPSGSELSRTGYTFGGWNTDASGTGTNYSAGSSYTVTADITLYAKWNPITYTVTFNINSGSGTTPSVQTASSGSSITLPSGSGLSRTGYTFGGWNTDASGTGTNYSADSSYTVTGNVTLYAKWADSSTVWMVKFETNGGSAVGDAVVLKNTPIGRPAPDPTKTGYTFDNWYSNTGLTTPYNFSSIVTGNITLYAKWNPITYTVAYNANGGMGDMANSSHTYDVDKNLASNGFTYTGYTFAGWARTSTGAVEFTNGQSVKNLTATAGAMVTLYAKWEPITYTVTFNINSGSGTTPSAQTANSGSAITLPSGSGLSRTGYTFGGWNTNTSGTGTNYNAGASYTVTGTVTLYAKWDVITNVPGSTLAAKLSWLQTNALSNVAYTVEVSANESISPTTLSYSGRTNIGITLKGISAVRTVSISSNGAMFTVPSGVTLVLDNNITLQGRSDNTNSLVRVNGGTLVMNAGSKITGNTYSTTTLGYPYGGGVYVGSNGTFTMSGGEISGNTASTTTGDLSYGGGVSVYTNGTFTMSGGTISGNTSSGTNTGYGGGVSVYTNGTFTMEGGEISGNIAGRGGGVVVSNQGSGSTTFTMTGGVISGNTASSVGGGVEVSASGFTMSGTAKISGNTAEGGGGVYLSGSNTSPGTFTMSGGEIFDNTAVSSSSGGGVSVASGTFTMTDGEISDNTAYRGGGVDMYNGTFTMEGGKISNNTASVDGGGVYVMYNTIFTMTGGEISDNTANDGGGVYVVYGSGTFTMSGGTISGNTALSDGGGVYVRERAFTMNGGTISGNTASSSGGGVYMNSTDTFAKTGGTIYGYSAGDTVNSNKVTNSSGTVQSNRGHAVYVESSPAKRRETTAGTGVNLAWNGKVDPPTFSGEWED